MKKEDARAKLEKRGYTVTLTTSGYIAKKGYNSYMSGSLNGLVKKIF